MAKYLCELNNEKVELTVIECNCGFHLGLDSTYLDQVDDIEINCPSCNKLIQTAYIPELKVS